MKAMKFKVNSPEHSKAIQEKLFEMGYSWCGRNTVEYTDKTALYAGYFGGNDITYGYFSSSFDNDVGGYNAEEHFLISDAQGTRFVTKDYWTQPKTPEQKPVEHVPIGLRPRHIALRERNKEILEAIGRYVEAGKVIPREWLNELMQNNEEME